MIWFKGRREDKGESPVNSGQGSEPKGGPLEGFKPGNDTTWTVWKMDQK